MIAVVSYGVSNVASMLNMLRRVGAAAVAVSTPSEIKQAQKLILPGVGAFDTGMRALSELGLAEPLKRRVAEGAPILGVCLGMQLLGHGSEEGSLGGLGLLDGRCVRLRSDGEPPMKVPQIGWNVLRRHRADPILDGLDEHARFYFVHSYYFDCRDPSDVLATTTYGTEFTAMVQRGNVWGAQFHPEKSHRYGMTLLASFAKL